MPPVSFIHSITLMARKVAAWFWPVAVLFVMMLAMYLFMEPYRMFPLNGWISLIPLCVALVLFHLQREGAGGALVVASLCCICHGWLLFRNVARVLLLPVLPETLWDVPPFLERVNGMDLLHGSVSLLAGLLVILHLIAGFRENMARSSTLHGSARLATFREMLSSNRETGIPLGLMPSSIEGRDPLKVAENLKKQKGGKVFFADPAHTVVIAPSGSGKGVGYVVPTLLEYDGPVIVTDIKGENYAITARHRRTQGRNVLVFDPFGLTDTPSVRINPLDSVSMGRETAIQDAASLAGLIVPPESHGSSSDRYFSSQAASLIQCLILYVLHDETFGDSERNLGAVYDLLHYEDMKDLFHVLENSPEMADGVVARLARGFVSTDAREFSGIINTARVQLRFMDSKPMRDCTAQTDLDWEALVAGETDLYICIPSEHLDTQARLVRLLISLVFQKLEQARGRRCPKNILMVLDEMPALGYMRKIEQILVYGRGYGAVLMVFSQTLELLASTYPKTWQTFLSSNITVFFDASEHQTASFASNRLGRTTMTQKSVNSGETRQNTIRGSSSEQESTTMSHTARSLLSPDEIMCLGDQVSLVFLRGSRPLMLKKPDYRTHVRWKGRFDANPLHRG